MTEEEFKALTPDDRRLYRRLARRQIAIFSREYLRPLPAERRAWLEGYLSVARKALQALS